jgi:hypothetical protein
MFGKVASESSADVAATGPIAARRRGGQLMPGADEAVEAMAMLLWEDGGSAKTAGPRRQP